MAKRNKNGLTDAQQLFADAYLKQPIGERNATKAYQSVKPGASQKTAEAMGSRLTGNVSVAAYIEKRDAEIVKSMEQSQLVTQEDIIKELMHVAFGRLTDVIRVDEDGNVWPESTDKWDDRSKAALKTLKMTTNERETDGKTSRTQRTEMAFHDKLKALELLGRNLKMFTDKVEHELPDGVGMVLLPATMDAETWQNQVQQHKKGK